MKHEFLITREARSHRPPHDGTQTTAVTHDIETSQPPRHGATRHTSDLARNGLYGPHALHGMLLGQPRVVRRLLPVDLHHHQRGLTAAAPAQHTQLAAKSTSMRASTLGGRVVVVIAGVTGQYALYMISITLGISGIGVLRSSASSPLPQQQHQTTPSSPPSRRHSIPCYSIPISLSLQTKANTKQTSSSSTQARQE